MAPFSDTIVVLADLAPVRDPAGLLWPVYAWRVLIHGIQREPLDLFQRALLQLARLGVRHPERVCEVLPLPRELVELVGRRLHEQGLLDDQRQPSSRALRLLDDDGEEEETIAGYVFLDALNHQLWPWFQEGLLDYLPGTVRRDHSASFELGDEGRPRRVEGVALIPRGGHGFGDLPALRPPEILRAFGAWRRRRRHRSDPAQEREGKLPRLGQRARATVIQCEPQPMFVASLVVLPSSGTRWQVVDPLDGRMPQRELRNRLADLSRGEDGKHIRRLLERLDRRAHEVDPEQFGQLAEQARRHAELAVQKLVGHTNCSAELREQLCRMEESLSEGLTTGAGPMADLALDARRRFLRQAHAALELLLADTLALFPCDELAEWLSPDAAENGRRLGRLAREQLGFRPDRDCRLLRVTRNQLQGALRHGNRDLPELVAATLLSASRHREHPLRELASELPELFEVLHELKRERDVAAHDGAGGGDASLVRAVWRIVHLLVQRLLPGRPDETGAALPPSQSPSSPSAPVEAELAASLSFRLRAQALHQVEQTVRGIGHWPRLRDGLVRTEYAYLRFCLLNRATISLDRAQQGAELALEATCAAESALRQLWEASPPLRLDGRLDRRDLLRNELEEAARRCGFTLPEDGRLPRELSQVRPDRVRVAAETGRGTLAALVACNLLASVEHSTRSLPALAQDHPRLLLELAELATLRGHGQARILAEDEAERIRELIFELARAVLQILVEQDGRVERGAMHR